MNLDDPTRLEKMTATASKLDSQPPRREYGADVDQREYVHDGLRQAAARSRARDHDRLEARPTYRRILAANSTTVTMPGSAMCGRSEQPACPGRKAHSHRRNTQMHRW
jgi:hypothetical protein